MNMSKRDCSGWVLCPSQRFAGKFYFFNTLSGEAVWSLNELEVSWNVLRHFCTFERKATIPFGELQSFVKFFPSAW